MISLPEPKPAGKIITFYSYKGGTGRSMALANVAWALAAGGKRVLSIDWDLEAPGLHRYFEPFLSDPSLEKSTGVIDFVRDFAAASVGAGVSSRSDWYREHSDLLAHTVPLDWDFGEGVLHLVPAGKQDAAYPVRVNSFDWSDFYERLDGGILLEIVKKNLREVYDFILIDSRTGVSDTSGLCTIQMPDELVVCFTLNRQSIYGASAAARSAFKARHGPSGNPTLRIWPIPTRVENSEKDRLEFTLAIARARFAGLMHQLGPDEEDRYWSEVSVNYEPYYAYEEVLAAFRERARPGLMLSRMRAIAEYLNEGPFDAGLIIDQVSVSGGPAAYATRSARDYEQEFTLLGDEYESIRNRMPPGNSRTQQMSLLVGRVQILSGDRDTGAVAEKLFSRGTDGSRVVGLALARKDPQKQHIEIALAGIAESRSAFEQFNALMLAQDLCPLLHPTAAFRLRSAIQGQLGSTITAADRSRWLLADRLLKLLSGTPEVETERDVRVSTYNIAGNGQDLIYVTPASPYVKYNDGEETHGLWVKTRGPHAVQVPKLIRMGRLLVTNSIYLEFVKAGGYEIDAYWSARSSVRRRFVTRDGLSRGPAFWPNANKFPEGAAQHPVSGISYLEATAFVVWCNATARADDDGVWSLPREDEWEFVARSEEGFIYPWGDAFDTARCNSAESGLASTSDVRRFETGASKAGCLDMAGNVWEYIWSSDARDGSCVLRGGSFTNDRFEVRSYLRLFDVPVTHRPWDFGFRLSRVALDGRSGTPTNAPR